MSPGVRWLAGCIVAVALLGAGIGVHRYVARTQPDAPTTMSRPPVAHLAPRERIAGGTGEVDDEDVDATTGGGASLAGNTAVPLVRRATPLHPESPRVIQRDEIGAPAVQPPAQAAGDSEVAPSPSPADAKAPALSVAFSSSTPTADQPAPVLAQDIHLDPDLDATLFPPTALFALPDRGGIDPDQGTIALWIRMKDTGGNGRAILDLSAGTWENHLNLAAGPTFARFLLTTTDGSEVVVFAHTDFSGGAWHNTAVTWGEAQATIYIDGQAQFSTTYSGTFTIPPNALLYVASPRGGYDPSPGVVALRDLRTYQRILAPEEIATLVEQSVPAK